MLLPISQPTSQSYRWYVWSASSSTSNSWNSYSCCSSTTLLSWYCHPNYPKCYSHSGTVLFTICPPSIQSLMLCSRRLSLAKYLMQLEITHSWGMEDSPWHHLLSFWSSGSSSRYYRFLRSTPARISECGASSSWMKNSNMQSLSNGWVSCI